MEARRISSGTLRAVDPNSGETESGRMRSRGMQYRRLMLLGTGGMATVHLSLAAGPSGFNRLVVVKAIRDELLDVPEARAMFLDEARLCARLNHPNVVQVSEVVDSAAGVMIVMEYLDGRPLSGIFQAGDGFSLTMRLRVVCEILAGLHYVHELRDFEGEPLGLVHRDVSPHNVFVTFDGRVKLLDFGIAKATYNSEHTRSGVVKGKLTYMPAEQLRGQPVDRRADIYSVGCILWEAIAGARIWAKRSDKEIMTAVLHGDFPKLSERVEVDPRLERIVERAIALEPEARYTTAEEMRLELEELLATTTPVSTRDIGEFLSVAFAEANKRRHAEIAQLIAALPESSNAPPEIVATEFQASVTTSHHTSVPVAPPWRKPVWALVACVLTIAVVLGVPVLWRRGVRNEVALQVASNAASNAGGNATMALSVTVVPKTARVSVDGAPPLVGSALVRLAPGEHIVRAESDGYSSVERHVTLSGDTSITIELEGQSVPSASQATASAAPEQPRKSQVNTGRNHYLKAAPVAATAARSAEAGSASCSPPYYFVGGIKTFKPECI